MKKYRVYLSDITWNRVSNLFPKEDRGWLKSDIVFMETMPYKELSNVRNEITWHLVSNDCVEENEKLHSIIKEVRECINHYAIEDEDYSKIYNDEEKTILEILDKVEGDNRNE